MSHFIYYYSVMPITITYDLNNEQESKLILSYWLNFYFSKDYNPSIIKYHLNKTEFKRFKKLYQKILIYHYGCQITLDNMDIFLDLFLRGKKETLKIYKSYIKYKLPKK